MTTIKFLLSVIMIFSNVSLSFADASIKATVSANVISNVASMTEDDQGNIDVSTLENVDYYCETDDNGKMCYF